jgi:ariadne-1
MSDEESYEDYDDMDQEDSNDEIERDQNEMEIEENKESSEKVDLLYDEVGPDKIDSEKEKLVLSLRDFAISDFGVQLPLHVIMEFLKKGNFYLEKAKTTLMDQLASVLESTEIPAQQPIIPSKNYACEICWNEVKGADVLGLECGHSFCKSCYKSYIEYAVSTDLASAASLKCPLPNCKFLVTVKILRSFLSMDIFEKLLKFSRRSFIENSYNFLQCNGEDCPQAFLLKYKGTSKSILKQADLWCRTCLSSRCTKCEKNAHMPVPCSLFSKWCDKAEGRDDSVSAAWIKTNTNPCPKCKRQIEKNQGCMHMTCLKCRHEFCWLCFGDWVGHNSNACNMFKADSNEKNEEQRMLKKFEHYYNRYNEHSKSVRISKNAVRKTQELIFTLENGFHKPSHEFNFLIRAQETSLKARQTVANSYALSYQILATELQEFFDLSLYFLEHQLEHLDNFLEGLNHDSWFSFNGKETGYSAKFPLERQKIIMITEEVEKRFRTYLKETTNPDFLEKITHQKGIFSDKDKEEGWVCSFCQRLNPKSCTTKCYRCEKPFNEAKA